MAQTNGKQTTGDCEFCERTEVNVTVVRGDLMCDVCRGNEATVVEASTKIVAESRQNDTRIETRNDVFVAVTTAFIELQGAIHNNPEIPVEQKKFALAQEVTARVTKYDEAIFARKAELAQLEHERFAYLKNLQPLVATLKPAEQSKFKQFNVNYKPQPAPKPGKSKSDKTPKSPTQQEPKFSHKAITEICANFKVDVTTVKMMMLSRHGLTPTQAAEELVALRASRAAAKGGN